MSWRWARQHWNGGSSVLLLLSLLLWHGRVRPAGADNASQAYYTALINVTVLSPERGGPTLLRIDRGRYGQDSPKVEVKGLLVAPVPINGGNASLARSGWLVPAWAGQAFLESSDKPGGRACPEENKINPCSESVGLNSGSAKRDVLSSMDPKEIGCIDG